MKFPYPLYTLKYRILCPPDVEKNQRIKISFGVENRNIFIVFWSPSDNNFHFYSFFLRFTFLSIYGLYKNLAIWPQMTITKAYIFQFGQNENIFTVAGMTIIAAIGPYWAASLHASDWQDLQ